MKQINFFHFVLVFIFLIPTIAYSQSTPATYADDEIVIIFEESTTAEEIDSILEYFAMHIEDGPTSLTKAYRLKFDSVPPPWAYLNAIDPINGVILAAKTQSSTNGVGPNYNIDQPVFSISEKLVSPPSLESGFCYSLLKKRRDFNGGIPVKAGIFDTGINPDISIVGDFFDLNHLGYNYILPGTEPIDNNNHGTHISSIIMSNLGNGNNAISLEAYKTHGVDGLGTVFDAIQALDKSIEEDVKVINMSFSFNETYEHRFDGFAPMHIAIEIAKEVGGILCITSAGNEAESNDLEMNFPAYPASYLNDNIIAVASVNCAKEKSDWSNFGVASVDITAPGEEILGYDKDGDIIAMSGTSQATAFVSKTAIYLATYQTSFDYQLTKCAILNGITPLFGNSPFVLSNGYINPQEALLALESGDPCNYIPPPNSPDLPGNRIKAPDSLELNAVLANHTLQVEISSNRFQSVELMVSDITGRVLLFKELELIHGDNRHQFDLFKKIDQGIYFITLFSEEGIKTLKLKN